MLRLLHLLADLSLALLLTLVVIVGFGHYLEVPRLVQVGGRAHPLLLHLPIGLAVVLALLPLYGQRRLARPELQPLLAPLLHLTALLSVLTALGGQLLAAEGGYPEDLVRVHRWAGSGVAVLAYATLASYRQHQSWRPATSVLAVVNLFVVVVAGHWGARLTHGDDFLLQPLRAPAAAPVVTDSTPVFQAVVEPLLRAKCYGCHNENKRKGGLLLTTRAGLLAGGDSGPLWDTLAAEGGQLLQRLHLPLTHDDHMPPAGKPQLTPAELALIADWVRAGADLDLPLAALPADAPLRRAAQPSPNALRAYTFPAAAPATIAALQSPYCQIRPLAEGSPALAVTLRLREAYQPEWLSSLRKLAPQLVELDLANLPVRDADLAPLADFEQLERLNLNGTDLQGPGLAALRHCRQLISLSLSGSALTQLEPTWLEALPRLRTLYLGDSRLPAQQLSALRTARPDLQIILQPQVDPADTLQLNPPLLVNRSRMLAAGEAVELRHFIQGATIRYTLDGSEPDSVNGYIYTGAFGADSLLIRLRARAFSPGWRASSTVAYSLMRRGLRPDSVALLTATLPRMGRGALTLYDGEKGDNDPRGPFFLGYGPGDTMRVRYFLPVAKSPRQLRLSYLHNPGFRAFAPGWLQVWAGPSADQLRLVQTLRFNNSDTKYPARVEALAVDLPNRGDYRCIELLALARRPTGADPPKREPQLFVDEIVFYE